MEEEKKRISCDQGGEKPKGQNYVFGRAGEDEACKYLIRQGMEILERNFRCRMGEIDIIAKDGDSLVFAEVKTRRSKRYGSPLLAITPGKMRHLVMAAEYYMKGRPRLKWKKCRIDAVGVLLGRGWMPEEGVCGEMEISHIRGVRVECR